MNLVDVHCHLNHEKFKPELDKVLERAKKAGVKTIITSGINPLANKEVLALAEKYDIVKVSLGIYPIDALGLSDGETGLPRHTVKINLEEEFKFIEENKDKIVGIGEVGLDFHWDKEHHQEQEENFRKIIKFAEKINKPLIIHSRRAELRCIEIFEELKVKVPIVMHCFSGKKHLIKRGRDLGLYFSVPPNIIKLQHFQTLVELTPLDHLFTETDAPWLSPFPDKMNEPAFVVETIKVMAKIKEISEEEVAEQIWKNYENIFT